MSKESKVIKVPLEMFALKFLTSSRETRDTFVELGKEWDVSHEHTDKLRELHMSPMSLIHP